MSLEKVELLLRHEGNQFDTVIEVICNISWPKVHFISEEAIKVKYLKKRIVHGQVPVLFQT